jgi:hypothetical protein
MNCRSPNTIPAEQMQRLAYYPEVAIRKTVHSYHILMAKYMLPALCNRAKSRRQPQDMILADCSVRFTCRWNFIYAADKPYCIKIHLRSNLFFPDTITLFIKALPLHVLLY